MVLLHGVVGVLIWWAAAIGLFGLTIRQTIKLNIAFAVFHILLLPRRSANWRYRSGATRE